MSDETDKPNDAMLYEEAIGMVKAFIHNNYPVYHGSIKDLKSLLTLLEHGMADAEKVRELEAQITYQEEFLKLCTDAVALQKEQLDRLRPHRFSEELPPDTDEPVVYWFEGSLAGYVTSAGTALLLWKNLDYVFWQFINPPELPPAAGGKQKGNTHE